MLEHVKLNVHQLNIDHLYLELLTPCINTKNKKSKKEIALSLLYPSPTPPFYCHKKTKKKKGIQSFPITYATTNNQKN
jgi:hypothetical protein